MPRGPSQGAARDTIASRWRWRSRERIAAPGLQPLVGRRDGDGEASSSSSLAAVGAIAPPSVSIANMKEKRTIFDPPSLLPGKKSDKGDGEGGGDTQ